MWTPDSPRQTVLVVRCLGVGILLFLVALIVGAPAKTASAATGPREIVVFPMTPETSSIPPGLGSGIQFLLENVLALTPQAKESWFHWYGHQIFADSDRYGAFLSGEKEFTDRMTSFINKRSCDLLTGTVGWDDHQWRVTLVLRPFAALEPPRKTRLVLDLPACRRFRTDFMAFMGRCAVPFPPHQKEKALWPISFTAQGLAAAGRAYEAYCALRYAPAAVSRSIPFFEQALARNPRSYLALTLNGWADYQHGRLVSAITAFETALAMNPCGRDAQNGLMWAHARLGNEAEALAWGRRAQMSLGMAAEMGVIDGLCALANRSFQGGDVRRAETYYRRAMTTLASRPDASSDTTARVFHNLGMIAYHLHEYADARAYLKRAVALRQASPRPVYTDILATLTMMARNAERMGEYALADDQYMQVLQLRETYWPDDPLIIETARVDAGRALYLLGRYEQAVDYHRQALAVRIDHLGAGDPKTAESFHYLSMAHQMLGNYGQALDLCEKALAIRLETAGADHLQTAASYNEKGTILARMGDAHGALAQYDRCLSILTASEDPDLRADVLHNRGIALTAMGEFSAALDLHRKALELRTARLGASHPLTARSYTAMGCAKSTIGDIKGAIGDFERVLSIRQSTLGDHHPLTVASYFNLGTAFYFDHQFEKASQFSAMAIGVAQARNFRELSWRILDLLREVYEKRGRVNEAIVFGKMAVNGIQALRQYSTGMDRSLQIAFMKDKWTAFENLAYIMIDQNRLGEAQEVLWMLKEESYFDFILRDENEIPKLTGRATLRPEEFAWFERFMENIRRQRWPRIVRGGTAQKETTLTLRLSSDDFLPSSRYAVDPGTVLLEYNLPTERDMQIILTTPHEKPVRASIQSDISIQELNGLIVEYLAAIKRWRPDTKKLAKQLYDILIGPIAIDLGKAHPHTVIVTSQGALANLPWAALHNGKRYLVEDYAVILGTSTPSTRDGLPSRMNDVVQPQWAIAGFGTTKRIATDKLGPVLSASLNKPWFDPLPSVRKELDQIIIAGAGDKDGIFPGIIKLDEQFNQQTFTTGVAKGYPVVHVSAHFFCNPGTAENSFLVLGDGTPMSLNALRDAFNEFQRPFGHIDLFTLSACQTAVRVNGRNDEFRSLGTLIQTKGANCVIGTLWNLLDATAPVVMEKMYRLRKENASISVAKALQEAQRWLLRNDRLDDGGPGLNCFGEGSEIPPFVWAPFIVMEGQVWQAKKSGNG